MHLLRFEYSHLRLKFNLKYLFWDGILFPFGNIIPQLGITLDFVVDYGVYRNGNGIFCQNFLWGNVETYCSHVNLKKFFEIFLKFF